jgi:squalene-associated FAD-dependent desaturase
MTVRPPSGPRVVVVGGGLAGVSAALDCAEAGARVTLLEVRRQLGGAAYSFQRDGLHLDNGQHVFLRCCTAYRDLLRRLGSEHRVSVQPRLEIPVLSPGRPLAWLRRSALPAPLHLAGALARYPHLSVAERLGAVRAALALGRLDPQDPALEDHTLGAWLGRHGQGPAAVAALWDLIALPTLNLPAAQASLALGAFVFQTGLLARADAADVGFHRRPLSETLGVPAARALERAGVEVKLGWRAQGLTATGGGLEVHGVAEDLDAEAVILAVPHHRAGALLERVAPDCARGPTRMRSAPIVNLHLVYDRAVCDLSFAAGVGTPIQYLFDRTDSAGLSHGQYLAISLSGADADMKLSPDALRERYLPALAQLLPRVRAARLEQFVVTREHAATFRAEPGVGLWRPGPDTPVGGLALAGAWTATGWPATLEGAVLSGHAAARRVLRHLGLAGARAIGRLDAATSAGAP